MPDDNLFPNAKDPDVPTGTPPADPPAKPNGDDSGTPLTMEMGAEMVTQAMAPLADQLQKVGETLAQLQQNQPTPPTEPALTAPAEDFLTRFSADPEGAVTDAATAPVKALVPLISSLMNSAVGAFTGMEAAEIDQEFGPGAWKKHFDGPMTAIINNYRTQNAQALADRGTLTKEVNGLKGVLFNELVEFRENSRKTAAETADSDTKKLVDGVLTQIPRTNLTGGIRRTTGGAEEIPEGLEGYLADRARAIGGEAETGKDWMARTDYGNSLTDYLAHQEKSKGDK